jgi:NosR/NirI family nitrous oxide reductase transcriptional regulator
MRNTYLRHAGQRWQSYTHWLHTRWPAGAPEPLPAADEHGRTSIPGVYIVGDLTGIPLLKFALDSGARAAAAVVADFGEPGKQRRSPERQGTRARGASADDPLDLAIVGGGVAGIAAAVVARRAGLNLAVFEAAAPFSTIANFPKAKPIYTYPTEMRPAGDLQVSGDVKEALLEELEAQRRAAGIEVISARIERLAQKGHLLELHHADGSSSFARKVIVAIGRSGDYRKLNVPGEDLDKVSNRLHDPADYAGKRVLVVGGGDTAIETTVALVNSGADVTLSYRGASFSRPKPENLERLNALATGDSAVAELEKPSEEESTPASTRALVQSPAKTGRVTLLMDSHVERVTATEAIVATGGQVVAIPNDYVFTMLGRDAPLSFFRRSGVPIRGEWRATNWLSFTAFFAFCWFLYLWKATGTDFSKWLQAAGIFPFRMPEWLAAKGGAWTDPASFLGTLGISMQEPGFYYTIAYCLCVTGFGLRRMWRRPTPYIRLQTWTLIAFQLLPLFIIPYLLLPWAGHNGWFDGGAGKAFADALFPEAGYGHGREYWRAFGLILAWPLFIWNVFSQEPLWAWLGISLVQTFIIIPLIVRRWGKGAYCGWICSCGALAETLGDQHRHKMPHGPRWNRLNMVGQVILGIAFLLLALRIVGWLSHLPFLWFLGFAESLYWGLLSSWSVLGVQLNYYHVVDILLAGIVGVGFYFWFSGRVWCRFACPLAALMHIYARFSRFRIFADKKKCISCNVCTSVCHQGIDVMNFANKGLPMEDPQCVRCSACVTECPTGVLAFGRFDGGVPVLDRLAASPVRIREER